MVRERENRHALPSWLGPLIKANFYSDCSTHHKYKTHFCYQCMGKPLCECCWIESDEHRGHRYIKTYRASRRPSVAIGDIGKFIDISGIQNYIINGKIVVYLATDIEEDKHKRVIVKKGSACITCYRPIMDKKNKFCSIDCKIRSNRDNVYLYEVEGLSNSVSNTDVSLMVIHGVGMMEDSGTIEEKNINDTSSCKRKRKGIPYRSPFF